MILFNSTKNQMKTKPRITTITIARLFNTGNYEHVRYELCAEVPEGHSAAGVFKQLTGVLANLAPKGPVDESEYLRALEFLKNPDDWNKNIENAKARKRLNAQTAKACRERVKKYEAWRKARIAALDTLDQLGGSSKYTDAKDTWDENQ